MRKEYRHAEKREKREERLCICSVALFLLSWFIYNNINPRVSSLHQQPKENYTLTSSLPTICIAKTLHPSSLPHTLAIYPAALESCMDGWGVISSSVGHQMFHCTNSDVPPWLGHVHVGIRALLTNTNTSPPMLCGPSCAWSIFLCQGWTVLSMTIHVDKVIQLIFTGGTGIEYPNANNEINGNTNRNAESII